jgi:hypothetical protein
MFTTGDVEAMVVCPSVCLVSEITRGILVTFDLGELVKCNTKFT